MKGEPMDYPPLQFKVGDKVFSAISPDHKTFVVKEDGKLEPIDPWQPGDRLMVEGQGIYVLQPDGKTWSLQS